MKYYYSCKFILLLVLCLNLPPLLLSQESSQAAVPKQDLKRSFIGIELGQTMEQFRQQISKKENKDEDTLPDGYYHFLYDQYLSEIEEGRQTLIEVQGNGFVDKGLFQFVVLGEDSEPKLVAITIFLDSQWSSYDQIFGKLKDNYGNPNQLSPQQSIWQNDQTIIRLEKQLRYKILDKMYLDQLKAKQQKVFDLHEYRYEQFLEKF